MKKLRVLSIALLALFMLSCEDATIEKRVIVEKVDFSDRDDYKYKVTLFSSGEDVHYYTNYKHQVGDTLVSLYEFTDNREVVLKSQVRRADSLQEVVNSLQSKNKELDMYNNLLLKVIDERLPSSD